MVKEEKVIKFLVISVLILAMSIFAHQEYMEHDAIKNRGVEHAVDYNEKTGVLNFDNNYRGTYDKVVVSGSGYEMTLLSEANSATINSQATVKVYVEGVVASKRKYTR